MEKIYRQLRQPCWAVGRCYVPPLPHFPSPVRAKLEARLCVKFGGKNSGCETGSFLGIVKFGCGFEKLWDLRSAFSTAFERDAGFGILLWFNLTTPFLVWTLSGDEWNPKGLAELKRAPWECSCLTPPRDSAFDDMIFVYICQVWIMYCILIGLRLDAEPTSNAHVESPFCRTVPCFLNVQRLTSPFLNLSENKMLSKPSGIDAPQKVCHSFQHQTPLHLDSFPSWLMLLSDVWVHIYHCDPYTGFLNRSLGNIWQEFEEKWRKEGKPRWNVFFNRKRTGLQSCMVPLG